MRHLLGPIGASLALCTLLWLALACEPAQRIVPPSTPATTGAQLYAKNCARCHGIKGDGKGETELETPARDFRAGGFAFGNTKEALFKVVSLGMPGRSAMPGFNVALSEDERYRIVDHLLTMVPPQKAVDKKSFRLEPKGRPIIARGSLPPIKKEVSDHARGLMIGYPGGMSFEYDVDSPRLLRARQGDFINRTDWGGRGGQPLKPLGKVFYEVKDGSPAVNSTELGSADQTFIRQYRASFTTKDQAAIEWSQGVKVVETIKPKACTQGMAFERRWEVKDKSTSALRLILDRKRPASVLSKAPVKGSAEGSVLWWHRAAAKGKGRVVYRLSFGSDVTVAGDLALTIKIARGAKDVEVTALVICTETWNDQTLDALKKEFDL